MGSIRGKFSLAVPRPVVWICRQMVFHLELSQLPDEYVKDEACAIIS